MAQIRLPLLLQAEAEKALADLWCEVVKNDLGTPEFEMSFPHGNWVEISLTLPSTPQPPDELLGWVEHLRYERVFLDASCRMRWQR